MESSSPRADGRGAAPRRWREPARWLVAAGVALAFLAALAAGPALFRGFQALLPAAIRDDAAVGTVWIGLALEGWLPPIVLLHALYETVSHVVRRAGGGWPTRGAGR